MKVTVNIYYTGDGDNARKFAEEMIGSGTVKRVRAENGNLRYEYFFPMNDESTMLLIDEWENEEAIDLHHKSEMMETIAALRKKYKLKMRVEKFYSEK